MNDKRYNSIEIGTLSNSNVTLNQNQDGVQSISSRHVEYEIDEGTIQTSQMEKHAKKVGKCLVTIVVSFIALFADLTGLLSPFNIPRGVSFPILLFVCMVVVLFMHHDFWVISLQPNTPKFKDGRWYEKINNRELVSYIKKAKCIYPKCEGFVFVVDAPPRERHKHSVVGKCSVDGLNHTYTIDSNGIGYPQKFDWRPPDNEKKA
jgi:hypothetical protein